MLFLKLSVNRFEITINVLKHKSFQIIRSFGSISLSSNEFKGKIQLRYISRGLLELPVIYKIMFNIKKTRESLRERHKLMNDLKNTL